MNEAGANPTLAGHDLHEVRVPSAAKSVRMELERLERMMCALGEIVTHRLRMRERFAELQNACEMLKLCRRRVQRYGDAASELSEQESQRGEGVSGMSQMLLEISTELSATIVELGGFARRADTDMDEFTRLAQRLQQEIAQVSSLPTMISQALFVRCGNQTFALPLKFVEEVRRLRAEELQDSDGTLTVKAADAALEVVRLDQALKLSPFEPLNGYVPVVVVNVGGRQAGVAVEEVLRRDDIVINHAGECAHDGKLVCGATILPNGSRILLIDVPRLIVGETAVTDSAHVMEPAAASPSARALGKPRPAPASLAATVAAAMQPAVIAPPVSIPGAQITGAVQIPVPSPAAEAGKLRLEVVRLQEQIAQLERELAVERDKH